MTPSAGWQADWRQPWTLPKRIPLRLRVLFRGAFLLLALATVALAFTVLQQEKEQGWRNYQDGFRKNQAQIVARLRHPTGQLALLNPGARSGNGGPLHPLVLPFSAIDFDDKAKAQQAVEMAGCQVRYASPGGNAVRDASLCVAVGNNPLAGGFIYAVGSFASGELVARISGEKDLTLAHRARVTVAMRGQTFRWVAPFEAAVDVAAASAAVPTGPGTRGRLTGFVEEADGSTATRPQRDFRGWLWQDGRCLDAAAKDDACERRSFFSIRLPIELFRDELLLRPRPAWPPADLDRIDVRVEMLPPGSGAALFDSQRPGATPPFALADLAPLLLPGESLRIRKAGAAAGAPDLVALKGAEDASQTSSPWLNRLIRQLPVDGYDQPIEARETLATPLGAYELTLAGDLRGVNRSLGVVATRVSWFVGAMLAAIALTWLVIELSVIRRITLLTKRAAAVGRGVKSSDGLLPLDVTDLRGRDELGLLAGVLGDLLQRVNDDVKREQIRVAQEKDQWHAVGHEIMSPLQSLLALHAAPDDPSRRYLGRMQQALRVLYGTASPSEAFESATLAVQAIDLDAFLRHVAQNAPDAGIADVRYTPAAQPVWVRADEYSLEDVVLHVLRNADRHRVPGTPVTVTLTLAEGAAQVALHNVGEPIAADLLGRIFEYGVSDQPDAGALGSRGQGLFVARTYMAKMGGTIAAENVAAGPNEGVRFVLTLQRAAAA